MHDSDRRPGVKVTGLLQLGLFFAAVSAAVAAGGADDLIWASPRNVSEGITFAASACLVSTSRAAWCGRTGVCGRGMA
jgi:hypothetical protein